MVAEVHLYLHPNWREELFQHQAGLERFVDHSLSNPLTPLAVGQNKRRNRSLRRWYAAFSIGLDIVLRIWYGYYPVSHRSTRGEEEIGRRPKSIIQNDQLADSFKSPFGIYSYNKY